MAQSILVFDFGTNEEAAQQARHKVEAWKQSFRLGNKLQLKFDREESKEAESSGDEKPATKTVQAKVKSAASKTRRSKHAGDQSGGKAETANGRVRVLIRLGFSDHEKLSHQRWLDRIPAEEPFKLAAAETIRASDPDFAKTAELFESLD